MNREEDEETELEKHKTCKSTQDESKCVLVSILLAIVEEVQRSSFDKNGLVPW